ncbi:PRC-barrel domain-containing protein [Nitratireductor luteus]|uniref:PRC-barrel domain-containing protein n=1 Tax=Nitratireductor luteus TaxID=2976980 RepID=UPI00223EBF8A|nr:PRC-barrel domain-containing protein [Nitratireductor luteus]
MGPAQGQGMALPEVARLTEDQYGLLLRSRDVQSAREMIEQNLVYGGDGEEIGDVTDLFLGPTGEMLAVVAEIGGLWGIGETDVSIPSKLATLNNPADGLRGVLVPVEEDEVEELIPERSLSLEDITTDIRELEEPIRLEGGAWRATGLIGDIARYEAPDGYREFGIVLDFIIEDGGAVTVVLQPGLASRIPDLLSVPFESNAVSWSPDEPFLDLSYSFEELMAAPTADPND